jgi:hypothetical protein
MVLDNYVKELQKESKENTKLIGKLGIIIERQNKKIVELESKINLLIKLNEKT